MPTAIRSSFPTQEIVASLRKSFSNASPRAKVLDILIGCAIVTILLQFAYAFLVGSYPFNAFLAGVFCCSGTAVLTLCLRLQISNGSSNMSEDRAFVDYALAMVVLFLACWCYIG